MRLFVGVELDDAVRARAAEAMDLLRQRFTAGGVRVDARWVPAENLHVTVWFIGHVDTERAAIIQKALAPPFATERFTLRFDGCGAFPQSGQPRVLWIGVTEGGPSMGALYAEVRDRLVPLGFEEEKRPYSAHLTIARVREAHGQVRPLITSAPADCGSQTVSSVTLFLSRLSPGGATYEPLLRVPLS